MYFTNFYLVQYIQSLQKIISLQDWMFTNKLKLNPDKTELMLIGNKRHRNKHSYIQAQKLYTHHCLITGVNALGYFSTVTLLGLCVRVTNLIQSFQLISSITQYHLQLTLTILAYTLILT